MNGLCRVFEKRSVELLERFETHTGGILVAMNAGGQHLAERVREAFLYVAVGVGNAHGQK
ncbi:hypothetical protein D3C84_916730 [compost metagenome]